MNESHCHYPMVKFPIRGLRDVRDDDVDRKKFQLKPKRRLNNWGKCRSPVAHQFVPSKFIGYRRLLHSSGPASSIHYQGDNREQDFINHI